jgi:hypothetical protein
MRKLMLLFLALTAAASAQPFQFAVAGDSRDCGDVIMPAIANSVRTTGAQFYWHLGDFRKIYDFDEDMVAARLVAGKKAYNISDYEDASWPDFIEHQVKPFGDLRVYLGIGNHEVIPPKTKPAWIAQFGDWLTWPNIVAQRLADDPSDHLIKPYYHWIQNGVDFINVDNANEDESYAFDEDQMDWLTARFQYDAAHPEIRTIVMGGHGALPHSLSCDHSMNQTAQGEWSGTIVYHQLLDLAHAGKKVYLFASHSHFKFENVFDSDYWKANGGVLPGWIIGTAGAVRYELPDTAAGMPPDRAQTDVYGYYLVSVAADGSLSVKFVPIDRGAIPAGVESTYGKKLVDWCFSDNHDKKARISKNCAANKPCALP